MEITGSYINLERDVGSLDRDVLWKLIKTYELPDEIINMISG